MEVITLNIKSDHQTVSEALALLQIEIDSLKRGGYRILKVIHGYGSHGVGGAIKKEMNNLLRELKSKKVIEDYIPCERWTQNNPSRQKAISISQDLLVDFDLISLNSGVTIIII